MWGSPIGERQRFELSSLLPSSPKPFAYPSISFRNRCFVITLCHSDWIIVSSISTPFCALVHILNIYTANNRNCPMQRSIFCQSMDKHTCLSVLTMQNTRGDTSIFFSVVLQEIAIRTWKILFLWYRSAKVVFFFWHMQIYFVFFAIMACRWRICRRDIGRSAMTRVWRNALYFEIEEIRFEPTEKSGGRDAHRN